MADPAIIPFKSKGKRRSLKKEGSVVDHGTIGGLKYDVYKRGVIHIKDDVSKCFKKDIDQFEVCLESFNFENLTEDAEFVIEGSGDNEDLIFKKKDGDIVLSLRKKSFSVIDKLKRIINKAKG